MPDQSIRLYPENLQTIDQIKDTHGIVSNAAAIRLALNHWAKTYSNGKYPRLKSLVEAYLNGKVTLDEFKREAGLLILSS